MVERIPFNVSNLAQQKFPFSLKLINYVNQEADAEVKQKLDRSCKYFFNDLPFLIVDTFEITEEKQRMENEMYDGCIDYIDNVDLGIFYLAYGIKKIWVTKKLDAKFRNNIDYRIFDKIGRCDASEISLHGFAIPFEKLKRLTKSRKVESFDMSGSSVVDSNQSLVPLEDVLSLIPNVTKIRIDNCHISRRTMNNMLQLPFKNKIVELSLKNVDGAFNANMFLDFVKKHADLAAQIHVHFNFEKRFSLIPWCARMLEKNFSKEFDFCHRKRLESGEKMPPIGTVTPPSIKKKQTWLKYFLSFLIYFALIFQFIQRKFFQSKSQSKQEQKKRIAFNEENIERQYTAFPYPHMCYIRENADAELWKKLERTCKFFFQKNEYFMVDDFQLADNGGNGVMSILTSDNTKMVFENIMEMDILVKPLWVTNSVNFDTTRFVSLPTFIRFEAKKINIGTHDISIMVFKGFTKSGLVNEWNSIDGYVKNADDKLISVMELLRNLSNAEIVSAKVRGIYSHHPVQSSLIPLHNSKLILIAGLLSYPYDSESETFSNISFRGISLHYQIFSFFNSESNKITHLHLQFYNEPIQAIQMWEIFKVSLAPKAIVKLDFTHFVEAMNVREFHAQIKALLDTWKPQIERPSLKIIT